jgi:hypothetical protein
MKPFYFLFFFLAFVFFAQAQNVNTLSPGKYTARIKATQKAWEKGDVIFLDNNRYKLSSDAEVGEYRFSSAAQRIFFTSGPLKGAVTKVSLNNNKTVIIFPVEQNQELGITAEVWASQ